MQTHCAEVDNGGLEDPKQICSEHAVTVLFSPRGLCLDPQFGGGALGSQEGRAQVASYLWQIEYAVYV